MRAPRVLPVAALASLGPSLHLVAALKSDGNPRNTSCAVCIIRSCDFVRFSALIRLNLENLPDNVVG